MLRNVLLALVVAAVAANSAAAVGIDDLKIATTKAAFADVTTDVSDAIVNRGYKIDYHGFIGKMLKRTRKDIGSAKPIYKDAEFYQFCSAVKSRSTMEADPRNIGYCPYVIFVYELEASPGTIHVGYRRPGTSGTDASRRALQDIDKLLAGIVSEATE